MNNTKIDWCDMSWNPVTGCQQDCDYCYANRIAVRFGGTVNTCPTGNLHVLNEPFVAEKNDYNDTPRRNPYPYMFDPTFHRYRLTDPVQVKLPQTIFVCSMGDLFGEWIPEEWIKSIITVCASAHWHRYLFLTKNPRRYDEVIEYIEGTDSPLTTRGLSAHFGVTAADEKQLYAAYETQATWLSIEPIQENMRNGFENCAVIHRPYDGAELARWGWVVIGAETGSRKEKVVPERKWIEEIVDILKFWKTPIYMKRNLVSIWGEELIQELPW